MTQGLQDLKELRYLGYYIGCYCYCYCYVFVFVVIVIGVVAVAVVLRVPLLLLQLLHERGSSSGLLGEVDTRLRRTVLALLLSFLERNFLPPEKVLRMQGPGCARRKFRCSRIGKGEVV